MARLFAFLSGFGLSVIGCVYMISYLNLMSLGSNFSEYAHFICSKAECLIGPIGLLIIFLAIFIPRGDKDELHL